MESETTTTTTTTRKRRRKRKNKKEGEEKEFCQPEEANEWKASNRGEGEGRFAAQISGKRKKEKKKQHRKGK